MDKKVFYGEYTLKHWVELILEQNIVLPEYQRTFVWKKHEVERFLKNLKDGAFIPPVIIGSLQHSAKNENIIIDGQQRLTSVLLGFIGKYPKTDKFIPVEDVNDPPLFVGVDADDTDSEEEVALQWTLKQITCDDRNKTKADILANIDGEKYEPLCPEAHLDDAFMNKAFLGFSYIAPFTTEDAEQRKYYCNVFHDINQQGVALQGMESRRSLYYLDNELLGFFEPTLCNMLKVKQGNKVRKYDYVRSLAFLSEYLKNNSEARIARSCSSREKLELYYENYINAVIRDEDDSRFGKFSVAIGKANIESKTIRLQSFIEALGFNRTPFSSIIEADTSLFGLIYHVVFRDKLINEAKYNQLKAALISKANTYKQANGPHVKSPNGLKYIRLRIRESITTYSGYII